MHRENVKISLFDNYVCLFCINNNKLNLEDRQPILLVVCYCRSFLTCLHSIVLNKRTMATGKKTNRLALEKSPYLLQHATNPVDWYPWGEEAFEKARQENKLIFLSVGYSTCHW